MKIKPVNIKKRFAITLLVVMVMSLCTMPFSPTFAAAPTPTPDPLYTDSNGSSGTDYTGWGDASLSGAGTVMSFVLNSFYELLYNIAYGFDKMITFAGGGMNRIIFGRVNGNGIKLIKGGEYTSLYTFGLENGNVYGNIGAKVYVILRSFCYGFISVVAAFKLLMACFKDDQSTIKQDIGIVTKNLVITLGLIFAMPYLLSSAIYLRDLMLKETLGELLGEPDFLGAYRKLCATKSSTKIFGEYIYVYTKGTDFMYILMYIAAVIGSLILGVMYVALALETMILFLSFPFICVKGTANPKVYGQWFGDMIGCLLTPIMDGILLCVPLSLLNASTSAVGRGKLALQLTALISNLVFLALRKKFRQLLGLAPSVTEEAGRSAAIGMLAAGAAQAANIGKAFKTVGAGRTVAKEAEGMAEYYETMAGSEGSDGGSIVGSNGPTNPLPGGGMGSGGDTVSTESSTIGNAIDNSSAPVNSSADIESATPTIMYEDPETGENILHYVGSAGGTTYDDSGFVTASNGESISQKENFDAFQMANPSNFDKMPYKDKLTNAQMASLYRQRAHNARATANTRAAVNAVGGMIGGMMGGVIGSMGGPVMAGAMSAGGTDIGNEVGNMIDFSKFYKKMFGEKVFSGGDGDIIDKEYPVMPYEPKPNGGSSVIEGDGADITDPYNSNQIGRSFDVPSPHIGFASEKKRIGDSWQSNAGLIFNRDENGNITSMDGSSEEAIKAYRENTQDFYNGAVKYAEENGITIEQGVQEMRDKYMTWLSEEHPDVAENLISSGDWDRNYAADQILFAHDSSMFK